MFDILVQCEPWFLFLINEEIGRCFDQLPEAPFDDPSTDYKLTAFLNYVLAQMKADPLSVPDNKYKIFGFDVSVIPYLYLIIFRSILFIFYKYLVVFLYINIS